MIISILAQQPTGPEFGKSSPVGLVIIVALLVGTAFLIWSMNKQIKKLPESFEKDDPGADREFDEGTDRGAVRDTDRTETEPRDS
ncbi:hypothetical protein HQ346_12675 [Rhodococcus sp. BP-252]|uniref:Uncharacterized protein n=1 Tax=Rhodococcoides kyotonense TaxID=398843 RepID=A0A177YBH3_9NOCA|nr:MULTISPECIES: hypothetical protein [Rhodococcus]NIL74293.1 hypothetical protein [Rhodococcus sp. B10]MBY6411740.1 hypothetical protein [Rhodococcus sp. BP-320]MBY6417275.1 hypothetical protein [Rhodococcus sp. BP-321]MBY6421940.1 hypothetical protein [Rhodococcus sp. BP-324]MBY6427299.1 hypothetical protein [Rhodococcus sp. BP-323]